MATTFTLCKDGATSQSRWAPQKYFPMCWMQGLVLAPEGGCLDL